jgi:hypothetical protein
MRIAYNTELYTRHGPKWLTDEGKGMYASYGRCLNRTWGCNVGPSARRSASTVIPSLPDPAGWNCCELIVLMKVT